MDERPYHTRHPEAVMSVDFLHVVIATFFAAIWFLIVMVLRPEDPALHETDSSRYTDTGV